MCRSPEQVAASGAQRVYVQFGELTRCCDLPGGNKALTGLTRDLQRRLAHEQLVGELVAELQSRATSSKELEQLLSQPLLPGM